ncbi:MAG: mechanosensitive ion channel family protein [Saprospiraceae bacterium]|nr:mechanosensitive ion channel family protein [Bacteroidia bacterium]NNE15215.1 mechanosensitive ion channel family protein [Saprospiraceae bacterium]NNL93240.1 mechanosensitive ion channel family protein [Saprospiraceae bacterium]
MDIINDLKEQFWIYYDSIISYIPRIIIATIISLIFLRVVKAMQKKLTAFLTHKADDQLLNNFMNSFLPILSGLIALLLFLYIVGLGGITKSIMGTAGVSAIVIGFAFKDIGENFLAGVMMAFNRPFRLGDTVKSGDVEGKIVELSLRDTHIKTFDGKDVYVPNGQILKNPVYNYTIDGFLRHQFSIGIDYDSDIKEARDIIMNILENEPGIIQDEKKPATMIGELGSSSINITSQYWINTFDSKFSGVEIKTQAIKKSLTALENAGINMPGNILELKNYNQVPVKLEN